MKSKLRVLAVGLIATLALSVPALAQNATPEPMSTDSNGLITYAAPNCDYGGELLSIQAVDASTVKMTLCHPDPALPSKVAFSSFAIHSYAQLQATGGGGNELLQHPIGTGPWKFDHWDQGNEIVLTRNDNYWGDKAKVQTLIIQWNTEAAARLVQLQSGNVDGIDNPDPNDFATIKADSSLNLLPREGLNVLYLGMNNTFKPFDDVKVRQAVAYAIDKQRIVDNFYPPGSSVADQFMPTSIFGYTKEVTPFAHDTSMAMQLLDQAAAADGFTLPITVNLSFRPNTRGYFPQPPQIAADIQSQLNSLQKADGTKYFNISLDQEESTTFLDATAKGSLPFFLLGWGVDYPDATDFLDFHFGAGAQPYFGKLYPDIVAALTKGAQLATPEERYPFYLTANTAIRDEVPMVPIAHGGNAAVFKASIENAQTSPLAIEDFAAMGNPNADQLVFMQSGEPGSLYCADETDGESIRVCNQVNEGLLGYEPGGTAVVPALASSYEANSDLTEWTFHLRSGVTFHDGSAFGPNDVVMSYAVQWDTTNPLHKGRTGDFSYFSSFFGAFLNAPPASS